jgi:hypothetical protein
MPGLAKLVLLLALPILVAWMPDVPQATPYQAIAVHSGPGHTFQQNGLLNPGVMVDIIERNRVGNWVHVTRTTGNGQIALDGWVVTGYLSYEDDFHLSQIPVNETLSDADPANAQYESTAMLYAVPVIPEVSRKMQGVYRYGQALGNHRNVVTKVGDSVSANPLYLRPMSRGDHELGPYDFLDETIRYFGPSLQSGSVASRIGMTTYVIFDPLWADKAQCNPNEPPLDCEYRLKKPAIAMIMFGPNDVRHMTDADFDTQIRQIVDQTIAGGIIPVLSTFSVAPDDELWWQSINFNLRLTEIATEYEVPLINLWAAARILPEYGLDQDGVHMLNSGFKNLKFSTGHEAWYGTSLQNLLSIRMLDELRHTLNMGK